ncbi:MAG TPA: alpha-amylase family glycosyl hydrolase, partial [Microlunatus sp.]
MHRPPHPRRPRIRRPGGTARLALTITLALIAALGLVSLPQPPDAQGADRTAALVGSLQSELGCPEDWQPACAQTELAKDAAGDTFSGVFSIPQGSWEFKVALNDSWDESYRADGTQGDANSPLVLAGPTEVRVVYDDTTHKTTISPTDLGGDRVTAADRRLATDSLRNGLTKERFYFLMADRFANGSTANDRGGLTGDRLATGYDPADKGFYHGGDLKGLTDKLDYIKGMGTTAIWLTPSFKNRPVQGSGANVSAGYHGYWITDFTQIDPHLGTNDDMKGLIAAAHAKGMKVFFDIITNHTADVISYQQNQYTYISKAAQPYKDANGNAFDDAPIADTSAFPPLNLQSFPYTPVFPTPADATAKSPAWLNDRTMYHNRGDSTFEGENSNYGDFFGLDDLFTERPEVLTGMEDIYKSWVDFGVDGFRIDTVKHVNMAFWQGFGPTILNHAKAVGKP